MSYSAHEREKHFYAISNNKKSPFVASASVISLNSAAAAAHRSLLFHSPAAADVRVHRRIKCLLLLLLRSFGCSIQFDCFQVVAFGSPAAAAAAAVSSSHLLARCFNMVIKSKHTVARKNVFFF
jgi:hypothetical protein